MTDNTEKGRMDVDHQKSTYEGFMTFLKVGTGLTFLLVLLLILIFANPFA
jgi:hypothetical protein